MRWLVSGGAKVVPAVEDAAGEIGLSTAGGGLGLALVRQLISPVELRPLALAGWRPGCRSPAGAGERD